MRLWELARYSLENAWRSRLRTLLTVVGIAIASGALVSMIGFVLGLRKQVEEPISKLGLLNNIEVRYVREDGEKKASPILDQAMIDEIEALNGVDIAYPDMRLSQVTIQRGGFEKKTTAFGLPRETTLLGISKELLEAGEFFTLGQDEQVVIPVGLLKPLGFTSPANAIGKSITLKMGGLVEKEEKTFEYEDEEMPLEVVGVFQPPGLTSLSNESILLPVELMRKMPKHWMEEGLQQLRASKGERIRGYPAITVRADAPVDVMKVQKKLDEMGFHTYSVMDRMDEMKQFFLFMEVLLTAVGTVALVVSGVGILNTLTMTVMERYQEIGIYKSIGASHGDIRWMFLVEAAAVGFVGGLAGLVLARVVSYFLGWMFNSYAEQYGIDGPEAVFVFPVWLLIGAVIYSITISVVSGIYPAGKAANIDPVQALRRG